MELEFFFGGAHIQKPKWVGTCVKSTMRLSSQ
jgi:hypothetical protein